jgi:hypothetical protein
MSVDRHTSAESIESSFTAFLVMDRDSVYRDYSLRRADLPA